MKIALFDLDGTLIDGYTWRALWNHHAQNRFKRIELYLYLGLHFPMYPFTKLGLFSRTFFYKAWGEHMAWLVHNVPVKSAVAVWDWIVEHEFLPNIRPEMQAALDFHREEKHRIVFISGTFQPLLDRLAGILKADAALATPLDQRNGVYTGRIIPPLNIGNAKVARMQSYIQQIGQPVDLSGSFMYTDSIVDLPLLQEVGNPVVVYPEQGLMKVALEKGWQVIGEALY